MKKIFLSILAALYVFSTTGANLELHYCMGRLADWSIGHTQSNTCGRCGMEKTDEQTNGCCNDERTFVKNTADQKPGNPVVTPVPVFDFSGSNAHVPPHFSFLSTVTPKPLGDAPLRSSNTPLHILISVFRI